MPTGGRTRDDPNTGREQAYLEDTLNEVFNVRLTNCWVASVALSSSPGSARFDPQ